MKIFHFTKPGKNNTSVKECWNGIPKAEKERFLSYYCPYAYEGFKKGNPAYANDLQKVFLFSDARNEQLHVAQAFLERLQTANTKQLLILSEKSRETTYYSEELYPNTEYWRIAMEKVRHTRKQFPHLTDAQYMALLCMGTFNSNGFYRQMCLTALKQCGSKLPAPLYGLEMSPLPFYLLRVNDWVSNIRELAKDLALSEICQCDSGNLLLALPALEKIHCSHRREWHYFAEIEETLQRQLQVRLPKDDLSMILNFDINNRNAVYLFLQRDQILSKERMEWLLAREKTGYGKKLLFIGITHFYDPDQADIERFLADKCTDIRYCALNYKYEKSKNSWNGLEKMLLDSSAKIRGMAGYILRRHDHFDVAAFYQDSLNKFTKKWEEETDLAKKIIFRKYCRISLLGIGENGSTNHVSTLEEYMEYDDGGIVRAAMQAYGMVMQDKGSELYWDYLTGNIPEYALTAYKLIRKYDVSYAPKELYEAYLSQKGSGSSTLSDKFLILLTSGPSWSRLEYLLALYDAPDISEQMKFSIREQCRRRDMYIRLSAEQVKRIKDVLERQKDVLPERLVQEILFDLKYV